MVLAGRPSQEPAGRSEKWSTSCPWSAFRGRASPCPSAADGPAAADARREIVPGRGPGAAPSLLRDCGPAAGGVSWTAMSEVSLILRAIEQGDPSAAEQLLPLVYDELCKLAAQKLAMERPGQTLQATALVHEAYLRLVGNEDASASRRPHWDGRGHFFAAAAEAMRRILIDAARGKAARKRGGAWRRMDLNQVDLATRAAPEDLLLLDDALEALARSDPEAARLVKLRYYGGLSVGQAAETLGLSRSTAYERWTYARAWLYSQLQDRSPEESG